MTEKQKAEQLRRQIEQETVEERAAKLAKAAQDPDRPEFHCLPSPGWVNDPNGPILWNGEYHMFYQHVPDKPYMGQDVCWAHAVSKDLVHWAGQPIALAPTPDSPDEDGCWTGMTVDNGGIPTIIYTGVQYIQEQWVQVQCIAESTDDMITWQKYAGNPVIAGPPEGLTVTGFRDPCAWREGDTWYVIIGSGIKDVGGTSLLYRSEDLIQWEYMHPLYECDGDRQMHECPDFFPLGDKYVLLTSANGTHWDVGDYADHKFTPEKHGKVDWGNYYAAKTMLDEQGRRLVWGCVTEARPWRELLESQWRGALSLPRVLTLLPDNTLRIKFVPELESLRRDHWGFRDIELADSDRLPLSGAQGDCIEVIARFAPNDARTFGVVVQGTKVISYDRERQRILDVPMELVPDGDLALHIYVDRSVIEIIANNRICKTIRNYNRDSDSLGVSAFAEGGGAKLKSIDIWEMKSIRD